jgi:hypothetical protein
VNTFTIVTEGKGKHNPRNLQEVSGINYDKEFNSLLRVSSKEVCHVAANTLCDLIERFYPWIIVNPVG